jgi:hypothetical protein
MRYPLGVVAMSMGSPTTSPRHAEFEEKTTHRAPRVRGVATSSCAAAVPTQPAALHAAVTAAEADSRRGWVNVGAVALGAFVIVMTETLPVGLLPQIADGLHV